jgi:hypothetical protein
MVLIAYGADLLPESPGIVAARRPAVVEIGAVWGDLAPLPGAWAALREAGTVDPLLHGTTPDIPPERDSPTDAPFASRCRTVRHGAHYVCSEARGPGRGVGGASNACRGAMDGQGTARAVAGYWRADSGAALE